MRAARNGHTETVTALLAAPDVEVNSADGTGYTALMRAAVEGYIEAVTALLAAPSLDVNAADGFGTTALMLAAEEGHTRTVRALLAAPGLDVNAATGLGWTALMRAAVGGHTETVWALLATPGLDVNTATDAGVTALMLSATRGHTATVRALLATLQLALAPRHSCTFYRASRVVRRLVGVRRRALSSRSPASPPSLATGPPSPRSHSLPVQRSRTLPYMVSPARTSGPTFEVHRRSEMFDDADMRI